ncbi:hypothetical protein EIP86_005054 [Pleurotus ostreatoroseus]|nr:hypothetical protein EIP86_005054 [Pleurotus ostreatoroseus]
MTDDEPSAVYWSHQRDIQSDETKIVLLMANRVPIARELLLNPLGGVYPDDATVKQVYLQADGKINATLSDRHVLLGWVNHIEQDETSGVMTVTQIVQLSGGPGNYAFHTPTVKQQSASFHERNTFYPLGNFTRAQRDRIIEIARGLNFNMKTRVNSCRTWTYMLCVAMIAEGLLSQETFDYIDKDVPLRKPEPEIE